MMQFNQFPPKEEFEPLVECLIHFTGYMPEHSIEKVIPDGSINLIFELDGMKRNVFDNDTLKPKQEFTRVWLSGIQRNMLSISAHEDSEMFVVRFKPAGAYPFLPKPTNEFTDQVIPAEEIFGREIFGLRDVLIKAESPEDKREVAFEWLDDTFVAEKLPKTEITESVEKILVDPHFQQNNLAELIEESGYSQKQFISLFKEYVGIAPKYFQRIVRFNEILAKIQKNQELSWTDISYECGFYDQAHFIKEFQHFCGVNPEAHLENKMIDERVNFFPVD